MTKSLGWYDPETSDTTQHLRLFEVREEAEEVLAALEDPDTWQIVEVVVATEDWIQFERPEHGATTHYLLLRDLGRWLHTGPDHGRQPFFPSRETALAWADEEYREDGPSEKPERFRTIPVEF